ncbi:MAG: SMP-30/gluconolactonase/LRE family protein [Bacteroidetes bacterium]|nr:SMP-30/gluconolactonase/LRE family protein [Bacteroidota bacterium]MCY4205000.1 SMP-30/gluconolactonase/LRE family protein [Bacteroidota bacterium]
MRRLFCIQLCLVVCQVFTASGQELIGSVQVLDESVKKLVAPNAQLEILAEGFSWSEGPVWISDGEYLLFSDVPTNQIYEWSEENDLQVFLEPSGYTGSEERGGSLGSNGLTLDFEGNLIIAQHGDRRIARLRVVNPWNPEPAYQTVVDQYKGARLNSPNDLVYHSNGTLYFTDPPYGLQLRSEDPGKELDFEGVFSFTPDGEITLLVSDLSRPNGLAFSPDQKTLYVSNSDPERAILMAYDVMDNGGIENGRILFDATSFVKEGLPGLPDGLKVDLDGNIFATGPGGILIISSDGTHLGTINTTQPAANCAFGNDGSMLYITANMYLLRIPLLTKGAIP